MSDPHFDQKAAQAAFLDSVARSFNNPKSSPDLLVKCDGEEFLCHKQVLCRQSEWFQTACNGGFKVGFTEYGPPHRNSLIQVLQEAKAHSIELHDDDKGAVRAMLQYCYAFTYDNNPLATFHVQVFALAEKYFVQGLAQLATDRFSLTAADSKTSIDDVTDAIAEVHNAVYDQGNVLRLAITNMVMSKADALLNGKNAAFDFLMDKHPSLAADVARALAKSSQAPLQKEPETQPIRPRFPVWKTYSCPDGCDARFEARMHPDGRHSYKCTKGATKNSYGHWSGTKDYDLTCLDWQSYSV